VSRIVFELCLQFTPRHLIPSNVANEGRAWMTWPCGIYSGNPSALLIAGLGAFSELPHLRSVELWRDAIEVSF
jgi:hypothetical protein